MQMLGQSHVLFSLKYLSFMCRYVIYFWLLGFVFRGGGGQGKKWHQDGRGAKKLNSIKDYIHCAKFLVENNIVQANKLAGWGYSAGGLVVASAINQCPDLFQAAVLKVISKLCIKKKLRQ